jgi:hypothetical protein
MNRTMTMIITELGDIVRRKYKRYCILRTTFRYT